MAGDSRGFKKKLMEFWEAICGGAKKTKGGGFFLDNKLGGE
jgi:hypothetical protein